MMRKGSLQLSINAIVILILAIAMLGVGIFFINNVLGDILEQPDEISEQLKQQLLQQLRESGTKFLISGVGADGVAVPLGKSEDIVLAVNNKEDAPIYVRFQIAETQGSDDVNMGVKYDDANAYFVEPSESVLMPVRFKDDGGSSREEEIWLIKVKYCRDDGSDDCDDQTDIDDMSIYASQSVFVTVK